MLAFWITVVLVVLTAAPKPSQGVITDAQALRISYNRIDTNRDGKIELDEFRYTLNTADKDHNGKVILREYMGTSTTTDRVLAEKIFNHFDFDNDGNWDEKDIKVAFALLDVNRDGGVSFAEYLVEGTNLLAQLMTAIPPTVAV